MAPQNIWHVNLNGTIKANNVPISVPPFTLFTYNITFLEAPGTYSYFIYTYNAPLTEFTPSKENGTVKVTDSNVYVNFTFNHSPFMGWAFTGAYANYSITQKAAGSTQYGYAYNSFNTNTSTGYYLINFTKVLGNSSTSFNGFYSYETDLTWSLPEPVAFIPVSIMLSSLNAGNDSYSNYILSRFINVRSNYIPASHSLHSGIPVHTEMGTYMADELSMNFSYSNGTPAPGAALHAYFDQASGMLLKYQSSLGSNLTYLLESTNIPMSGSGSRLSISVSQADSEVSVNGVPLALNLTTGHAEAFMSPGTYFMSITSSGYSPIFKKITLSAGTTTYENMTLSRSISQTYTVSGYVAPGNASVVVGGYVAEINSTGFYSIALPSGAYTISVASYGHYPETRTVNVNGNLSNENFTLPREPTATSYLSSGNITVIGFNMRESGLSLGNGSLSLNFSASAKGSLTIEIPYSEISGYSISDILNSRLLINGTSYSNFTVAITAQGGHYSVLLSVTGLSSDPTLLWEFTPPAHPSSIFGNNQQLFEIIGAVAVVAVVSALVVSFYRRRRP